MKAILALILVLALYDASALDLKVSRMKREQGYAERYNLVTNLDHKVVLDCQSFIQGLLFGPLGESAVMLEEWECDELTQDMKKSMSKFKQHCVVIDPDRGVVDSHQTCP